MIGTEMYGVLEYRTRCPIRWFKINHPNYKINVCTRKGREGLYKKFTNDIYTFSIDGDYELYRPNMYKIDFVDDTFMRSLIRECRHQFPFSLIITPPYSSPNRNYYGSQQIIEFDVDAECNSIIKNIISENKDKTPIVVCPRHRIDMGDVKITRNWSTQNWKKLFDGLDDKYLVFIAGELSSSSIPSMKSNHYLLNNYVADGISLINLTIEAIRNASCTIGQQSALPILSNFLKTPTVMWGNEKIRHAVLENPYKTKCVFHENSNFMVDVNTILKSIEGIVNE